MRGIKTERYPKQVKVPGTTIKAWRWADVRKVADQIEAEAKALERASPMVPEAHPVRRRRRLYDLGLTPSATIPTFPRIP